MNHAIDLAEREANHYAGKNAKRLGLLQGFWMFDECRLQKQGVEVFSLLRESDLPPKTYLRNFFSTGDERESDYDAEPTASPKHRPAPQREARSPRKGGGR